MNKIINYIHCPKCNGVIEMQEDESISITSYRLNMPRCRECGRTYEIKVYSKGIMKIEITEV